MIQVGLQWTMFSILIFLFLLYFPTPSPESEDARPDQHSHHSNLHPSEILRSEYTPPTWGTALFVGIADIAFFVICTIIAMGLINHERRGRLFAAWLGVLSMTLAAAQYLPQLWVTWRIKVLLTNEEAKISVSLHSLFQ